MTNPAVMGVQTSMEGTRVSLRTLEEINKIVALDLRLQHFPHTQEDVEEQIVVPIDYGAGSTSFTKILDPLFRKFLLIILISHDCVDNCLPRAESKVM